MALNTISRIHNKGDYRYEEHKSDVAGLQPGMLVEVNSDNEVIAHNSLGAVAERMFVMEDALQGDDVDHTYSANEVIPCMIAARGSVVNALLNAGSNYTVGTLLDSHGDGTLYPTAGGVVLAMVEDEALDLSGSGAVDTLHPVRIL